MDTGSLVELCRPRAEWVTMREAVAHCRARLASYAMAYRDVGWRDVGLADALLAQLDDALARPGDPLAIALSREAWLRHLDAFRVGVDQVRGAWLHGQDRPEWLAQIPDALAFPSIEASWLTLLSALPADCRDTERVCEGCERLLPLGRFARSTDGSQPLSLCADCHRDRREWMAAWRAGVAETREP